MGTIVGSEITITPEGPVRKAGHYVVVVAGFTECVMTVDQEKRVQYP